MFVYQHNNIKCINDVLYLVTDSVPQRRITSATSRGRPKSGLLKQKGAKQKRSSISPSPMQNTWAMSDNEEDF